MNEGAPSTLQTLVRRDGLTKKEWNHVIENLRIRINPFLDKVTLPYLGDLMINGTKRHHDGITHKIAEDFVTGGPTLTEDLPKLILLKEQGFFDIGATLSADEHTGWYVRGIWGINRNGEWVSGYVIVNRMPVSLFEITYQKALDLKLEKTTPDEIVQDSLFRFFPSRKRITYRDVWFEITGWFETIVEERKKKLEQVKAVYKIFLQEREIMQEIPEKVKN